MGADSILHELYAQSFARFVGATHRGHGQPIYYYVTQIWIDLLWWGPLLPFADVVGNPCRSLEGSQLSTLAVVVRRLSRLLDHRRHQETGLYAARLPSRRSAAGAMVGPPGPRGRRRSSGPSQKPARIYGFALAGLFLVLAIVMLAITFAADLIIEPRRSSRISRSMWSIAERLPAAVMALVLLLAAGWLFQAARREVPARCSSGSPSPRFPSSWWSFGGIMPALNPSKTYRPQCEWIRSEIGSEESFGLAYPPRGHHKMGGFSLYSGATSSC